MRADEAQLVRVVHAYRDIEKAALHFLRRAVELVRNVRDGMPRDDREAGEQREVRVGVRPGYVLEIREAEPRLAEPLLEVLELLHAPHLAHAEDVGVELL